MTIQLTIQQLQEKLQRHLMFLEQDPKNLPLRLTTHLLKAQILHHQHQVSDAITLLEQLILEHEPSAEIAGLLALLYFDNEDVEKAVFFSQKALVLNPANYEAQLVGMLLRALHNEATITEIEALITISPQDSRLWFALGSKHMSQMNLPAAEHAFSESTTIWPNFYQSWICIAWCYLLQNKIDAAHIAYQQAVNINSDEADGWGGLALVCALRHNMTEANIKLKTSDQLDPACFLAAVARIIVANQSSPTDASKQFNLTFPEIAPEINRILTRALLSASVGGSTIH